MRYSAEISRQREEHLPYSLDLLTIWRAAQELDATDSGKTGAMQELAPSVALYLGYETAYSDEIIDEVSLEEGELHPLQEADRLAESFSERYPDVHASMGYSLEDVSSRKFLRQVMVWHVHEARRRADEQVITPED